MKYKLDIIEKPTYLHFIITGENTRETIMKALEEIHSVCTARNCPRMLIEERLDGPRLSYLDVFNILEEVSAKGRGFYRAVAHVDVNAPADNLLKSAEDIAVNRSLPLTVFSNVAEAEKWLMNKKM